MRKNNLPTYSITDSKKTFLHTENQSADYIIAEASNTSYLSEKPYRTDFFGIGICLDGTMNLKANLFELKIKENSLIALNNTTIRSWHNRTAANTLLTAFFQPAFITKQSHPLLFLEQFSFFNSSASPATDLTINQAAEIKSVFTQMLHIQQAALRHKNDLMQHYFGILLLLTEEYFSPAATHQSRFLNAPQQITIGFKKQVSLHFREKRKVTDYAELLFVSPKHLSETIKSTTGKTAGEWIDEMVILEAKVLLQQTSLTISQIIDQLHFSDTSFFAKFFKQHTGLTPIAYRKQS